MAKRGNKKEDNNNENKDPQNRTQVTIQLITTIGLIIVALIGILPNILQGRKNEPTSTNAPTQTETSSSTALVYIEDFSKNTSSYLPLTPYEDDHWKGTYSVSNGIYQIIIEDKMPVAAEIQPNNIPDSSDLEIEVGLKLIEGISYYYYGVAFRYSSSGYYFFGINPQNQNYLFQRWEAFGDEKKWVQISNGTSQAINSATNNIKVTARGDQISAYINNIAVIAGIKDNTFSSGKVKLMVLITGGKVALEIPNFEVSIFR